MKINLTDNAAKKEARLAQIEAELVRSQATCTRLSQVICFFSLLYICLLLSLLVWLMLIDLESL